MSPVVVVSTVTPLPEHLDEVRAKLVEVIPLVHQEDGCTLYAMHEGDGSLVIVEQWASQDALDVHMQSEGLAALGAALDGKFASAPSITMLEAIPAGTPTQGKLR